VEVEATAVDMVAKSVVEEVMAAAVASETTAVPTAEARATVVAANQATATVEEEALTAAEATAPKLPPTTVEARNLLPQQQSQQPNPPPQPPKHPSNSKPPQRGQSTTRQTLTKTPTRLTAVSPLSWLLTQVLQLLPNPLSRNSSTPTTTRVKWLRLVLPRRTVLVRRLLRRLRIALRRRLRLLDLLVLGRVGIAVCRRRRECE
jgi:hypothetical protein